MKDKIKKNIKIIEVMLTCFITEQLCQGILLGDTQVSAKLSLNSTGL
jgi:hypothetical protein